MVRVDIDKMHCHYVKWVSFAPPPDGEEQAVMDAIDHHWSVYHWCRTADLLLIDLAYKRHGQDVSMFLAGWNARARWAGPK